MQVTPVSAIHALRIRQKPVVAPASDFDMPRTSAANFGGLEFAPAHVASAALQRDVYHGDHAEYAAQLLADRYPAEETSLERQRHVAHYASAEEADERSYTVSLTA